jgi:hypothetical protein
VRNPSSDHGRIRDTRKRFRGGYNDFGRHPEKVIGFFDKHLN